MKRNCKEIERQQKKRLISTDTFRTHSNRAINSLGWLTHSICMCTFTYVPIVLVDGSQKKLFDVKMISSDHKKEKKVIPIVKKNFFFLESIKNRVFDWFRVVRCYKIIDIFVSIFFYILIALHNNETGKFDFRGKNKYFFES